MRINVAWKEGEDEMNDSENMGREYIKSWA